MVWLADALALAVRVAAVSALAFAGAHWLARRCARLVAIRSSATTFGAIFRLRDAPMAAAAAAGVLVAGGAAFVLDQILAPAAEAWRLSPAWRWWPLAVAAAAGVKAVMAWRGERARMRSIVSARDPLRAWT